MCEFARVDVFDHALNHVLTTARDVFSFQTTGGNLGYILEVKRSEFERVDALHAEPDAFCTRSLGTT